MKRAAIETLQNLIAPGGRGRLSPYVEGAQLEVLFGESPVVGSRARSLRAISNRNSEKIERLAEVWIEGIANDKNRFCQQNYQRDAFLEMYLLYYFPTNVVKIQLSLLELVRAEMFQGQLEVVDLGVGTGTTFVALLDFFVALACVCDLYGIPFPLKALRYSGFDRSRYCLALAEQVSRAYLKTFEKRNPESPLVRFIHKAVDGAAWLEANLEDAPIDEAALCDVLVASNVFNELSSKMHFDQTMASLRPGALALVIEPGMAKTSRSLMKWRRNLLLNHTNLWSPGPCGQRLGRTLDEACNTCWNGRLEHLHEHKVYRRFRKAVAARYQDKRGFDHFENQLLSWSYIILKSGGYRLKKKPIPAGQGTVCSTYIGRYIERDIKRGSEGGPSGHSPDSAEVYQEYIKLCPAEPRLGLLGVRLKREPGLEIPPLRYGARISMENVTLHPFRNRPEFQEIRMSRETRFLSADANEKTNEYLVKYGESARRAVDELGCRLFGFPAMRSFQHVVFGQVLTGRSILAIAATGSGKSECFILPAIALSGATIVVSPLKSLMQDQFQRVADRYGLEHLATVINGDVPIVERQARLSRMELGYYKLIYFTPEQLGRPSILDSIRRTNAKVGIRYLAFDEAHCISHWGHDFRPSYLNIVRRLKDAGVEPVRIALTATASPRVRDDLCRELELNPNRIDEGGDLFVESSNRPELNLIVRVCSNTEEKVDAILSDLRHHLNRGVDDEATGGAIVFMPWTGGDPDFKEPITDPHNHAGRHSPGASIFASYLERVLKHRVALYHGKIKTSRDEIRKDADFGDLRGRLRSREQTLFLEGERKIMVATKGFGMGIDKPDIRLVIHRTPTANLEAYVQEAGRAGRDGNLADVVLYYSPDSTQDNHGQKIPSDKDIQDLFLSECIREIDVRALRAFLLQHHRKTKDALYFTNDEVFEFLFDYQVFTRRGLESYVWPEFVGRRPGRGDEYGEHLNILERGHVYQERTKHIEQVLAALFRVRPPRSDGESLVFLEDFQETPATIEKPVVQNYNAIMNASYDFGEIFRKAGMSETEFQRLLDESDLFKLAERLELDLRQLIWVLGDIKSIGGRYPKLLRYQRLGFPFYGQAARISKSLKSWRDYAGALKRARQEQASKSAREAGRKSKELDDWFGWNQMCSPKGWQVSLGPALLEDRDFERFLEEFMREYDTRSSNKLLDYRRLLTDYVGVNENGRLTKQADERCLRAVLLGYLKTDEVVAGDSCYGCNHCVPDEDFDRYPLELRKKAVQRVSETTLSLLRMAEENEKPCDELEVINAIFKAVEDELKRGRRLSEYLQGVTGRWLQDSPNHWSALWIRTRAMLSGLFPLQSREVLTNLERLADAERNCEDLLQLANQAEKRFPDNTGFLEVYARIARGAGDEALEELLLLEMRENSRMESERYNVSCRLAELYRARGDNAASASNCLAAARSSPSVKVAKRHYLEAGVESWDWSDVEDELASGPQSEVAAGGLLTACLKSHQEMVLNCLESDIPLWKDWSGTTTEKLVKDISPFHLLKYPRAAKVLNSRHPNQPEVTLVVLRHNPREKVQGLASLSSALVNQPQKFGALMGEPGGRWFRRLAPNVVQALRNWSDCELWIPWLVADQTKRGASQKQLNFLEQLLRHAGKDYSLKALRLLEPIYSQLFQDSDYAEAAHEQCRTLALQSRETAQYYLSLCESLPDLDEIADVLIDEILSSGNGFWLWSWTGPSPTPRWKLAIKMVEKLSEFNGGKATSGSWFLTDQEREELADLFEYKEDPEEAEMLAAVLFGFWGKTRDHDLLAPLADTLVYAGLYRKARELVARKRNLRIGEEGLPLEELISSRGLPESIGSINCDYQDLAVFFLRRWG